MTQLVLGAAIRPFYPSTKGGVLATVQAISGVTVPLGVLDKSVTLTQGVPATVLPVNTLRNFFLLYNPTQCPCQFALGSVIWNTTGNLSIGPGEAYFWASSQNLGPIYTGAVSVVGQFGGLPFWCWDSGGEFTLDTTGLDVLDGGATLG
jgi:hypothetical protein